MVFIIFMTLTAYTTIDLPKTMAQTAGRSSWIPIIVVSALFGIAAIIITKLNNMFLGKVFFDYSQEVIGKFFTYVIAVYYIFSFFLIGIYLNFKMGGVLESNFLPKTPKIILIILGTALFAVVAYKGITNIARLFEIYGLSFLIVTLIIILFMIADGDKYNILPFFNPADINEFPKTIKELMIPYGGLEILFIIPFTEKNKKAPKTAFLSVLLIGVFFALIVESTIMTLGINNTILLNDSFIEAVKITEAPVIERMDILYLTFGLSSLFSGMIIVFCAIVEYVCRIFSKIKRVYIAIAVFFVFSVFSLIISGINDLVKIFESFALYLVLVSAFLIPIVVFILAKIRKPKKKFHKTRDE